MKEYEKYKFEIGEGITFISGFDKGDLSKHHCEVSVIEPSGIWVTFDENKEKEEYYSFLDIALFIRDGASYPEGKEALNIDEETYKYVVDKTNV